MAEECGNEQGKNEVETEIGCKIMMETVKR